MPNPHSSIVARRARGRDTRPRVQIGGSPGWLPNRERIGDSSAVAELDETLPPSDVACWLAQSLSSELKGTLVERPRSTIEPRGEHPQVPADARGRAGLSPARAADSGGAPGFLVRQTLGEGGMGIVRAAEQISLGRQVAVKTVRSGLADDPHVAMRLLREAWLAGRVEHPNVVPIYDVGLDDAGRPHIAMRLVEGTPWDDLLRDPALVRERHGATDLLDWHLRVLVQVTHAVSRAHARGIVHRDIKPENMQASRRRAACLCQPTAGRAA